jgi:16S rRNA (adenine1518-N6/adenine1519-N6)-dimethyltransferase
MQLQAKKSLGQNFLHDEGILRRIAASANINSGDIVIEIGSGLGALTKQLLTTELSKLIAFEVDDRAIEILQREFSDTRFELRHQDFLEADLSTISSDTSNREYPILYHKPDHL